MKLLILFLFLSLFKFTTAQTAFQNNGFVQMHTNAKIGFHTHLVNNGTFNKNKGFTGFYNDHKTLTVSGNNRAIFNDLEIGVVNNLELYTSLGVKNELLFLEGKVVTPRNETDVSLDFINHQFYVGESNNRNTDGYTSVTSNEAFTFPIGDDNRFRPMILPNQPNTSTFIGAYFFENPNTPSTFNTNFITSTKEESILNISKQEFWDLDGTTKTSITLTWDEQSNIAFLTLNLNNLRIVGWNKATNTWENLGNTSVSGSIEKGKITSKLFIPNNYEILTIGTINKKGKIAHNYFMSPNKDNINDNLVIEGLENYKHNRLLIFNRWGNLVYQKEDYKNEFYGLSEGRVTFLMKDLLPVGTYFYIVQYGNTTTLKKSQKGWIYIIR